jgi:hypothetical protein
MVTKRQLGVFVVIVGLLVTAGTVGVDLVGAGAWSGFGPLQWIGIGVGLASLLVGAILIRLGNRPA